MELQAVKFVKHSGKYNPGEIAGFLPTRATALIKAGVAKEYTAPKGGEKPAEMSAPQLAAEFAAIEAQKAELAEREADLAKREEAAAEAAKPAKASEPPAQGDTKAGAEAAKAANGSEPPAQGGTKAAADAK